MTDKSLLDRLSRMVKVAPQDESAKKTPNSWTCRKSLTTEQKIYAISNGFGVDDECFELAQRKELKWKEFIRKCTKKCPWGVPWMMIVFSAVQLLFNFLSPSDQTYQLLAFSSNHKSEFWRFLTYSLLHAGTAHLIINVILQIVIALPLETETGPLRTFFVYLGGIFSGSLAASVGHDGLLMVGASSGIYGLLLSHLSHLYLNQKVLSHRLHRLVFVAVLTVSDVIHSLSHCLLNNNEEPKIHIVAHISGAVCGFLLGFIFYSSDKSKLSDRAKGAECLRRTSIACYATFVCFVVVLNVS